ncbi:RNA-guided endonuclease InsQ/TnpB family protein [Capilliphycus salinus ALCB114379]|uniref:RNA-guided endonuclease InsQ/TnpB family protein n=1 Tax=Capilliphycus salinus TaxID=2768948 RepID=UPI002B77BD6F|nr:RNA-guided endonuclease TnpB family protein [Lyngbya sp.]
MLKAYKYRIYPTNKQKDQLIRSMGSARWFYNYALNLTSQTYKETGKGLSRNDIIKLLPGLKKEHEWLSEPPSQCLQQVALDLSSAFLNFFEKRAKYPNFKKKHNKQSIRFPQRVKLQGDYLKLPKLGKVYCKVSRLPEGTIKSVTVSLTPSGQFYASCLYDNGKEKLTINVDGKAIGIDCGLSHFVITSDGSKHGNPKYYRKYETKLAKKQKQLSRKVKGSKNRNKARIKIAKVHAKITRCREDFLHKLSRKLVDENQVIAVENLAVKNMVKNHKLAKSISDAGWGQFCTLLKYKAEWEGKVYIEVDRFFPSSKTCHVCLNQVGSLPLEIREWTCLNCQTEHDRDINAAINIREEGLRLLSQCGLDGLRRRATGVAGGPERDRFWSSSKTKQRHCFCKALNCEGRIPR